MHFLNFVIYLFFMTGKLVANIKEIYVVTLKKKQHFGSFSFAEVL